MKFSLPRFDKIKDFSTFQYQLYSFTPKQQSTKFQTQNTTQTSDNYSSSSKTTRSIKNKYKGDELSFQSNFLLQHSQAFDFMIERYLRQMFDNSKSEVKTLRNEQIFPRKSTLFNQQDQLQSYLKSSGSLLNIKQSEMFMEDLSYEQKLYEFLSFICAKSCDQIALELIYIGDEIWQQYILIQHLQYSYQKLIEQAKKLVEFFCQFIKNNKSVKFITCENTLLKSTIQFNKKQEHFKEIIQFFIVTFFLILSQYFQNPYYGRKLQNQFKRHIFFNNLNCFDSDQQFSEDQGSQDFQSFIRGKKKIK